MKLGIPQTKQQPENLRLHARRNHINQLSHNDRNNHTIVWLYQSTALMASDRRPHSRNASWTALIAWSPLAKSITTEILISLVEIMSMFTLALARASNIFAAT